MENGGYVASKKKKKMQTAKPASVGLVGPHSILVKEIFFCSQALMNCCSFHCDCFPVEMLLAQNCSVLLLVLGCVNHSVT